MTIGKSVSIIVPAGIYAGVSVLSGDGITVNGIGISVTLQRLTINGQGGRDGIRFVQGARLNVVGCQIIGMDRNGVRVEGAGTVVIARSVDRRQRAGRRLRRRGRERDIVRSRIQSSGGNGIEMTGGAAGTVARTLVFDSGLVRHQASAGGRGHHAHRRSTMRRSRTTARPAGVYAEASGASVVRADRRHGQPRHAQLQRSLRALRRAGGTAMMSATGNDIVENLQVGVDDGSRFGGTTTLRASQNAVFRNPVAGLLQSSGSLYTNTNYVRDNDVGDNFGAQPDSRCKSLARSGLAVLHAPPVPLRLIGANRCKPRVVFRRLSYTDRCGNPAATPRSVRQGPEG